VKKRLADQNVAAQASTPEQATELLASEIKRWGDVIVRAKVPQQ
jgi:tripartite-type tricarboxylate transporter receptor subunit TctC